MVAFVRFGSYLFAFALAFISFCGCTDRTPIQVGAVPPPPAPTRGELLRGAQRALVLGKTFPRETNKGAYVLVQHVMQRLIDATPGGNEQQWRVGILHSNFVNATATEGNWIFVHAGLIKFIRTEPELAAALAHELGHIVSRHPQSDPLEQMSARLVSAFNKYGQELDQADAAKLFSLTALGFSGADAHRVLEQILIVPEKHRKEFEADMVGLFLLADAGYDPHAALTFFTHLGEALNKQDESPNYLASHPMTSARLAKLNDLLPEAIARYNSSPFRNRPFIGAKQKNETQS